MTEREVTDDELLRLARKAFPDEAPETVDVDAFTGLVRDEGGYTLVHLLGPNEPVIRRALHSGLLVLAGEGGDLRDRLDRALSASDSDRAARARAINQAQLLTSLLERAVSTLLRHGHADDASELQEALASALMERL